MTSKKAVEADEEVVELKQGDDGKYYPVAVVKVKERGDHAVAHNDAIRDVPRWLPAAYEMMNGFVIGLGAIENFMVNVKRMNRRSKRNINDR